MGDHDKTARLLPSDAMPDGIPTLEESTTLSLDDYVDDEGPNVPLRELKEVVHRFFRHREGSFLCRGIPYIDDVFYDAELECSHIWMKLRAPIRDPSKATIQGVRGELEILAVRMLVYFEKGVAISAQLN